MKVKFYCSVPGWDEVREYPDAINHEEIDEDYNEWLWDTFGGGWDYEEEEEDE